MTRHIMEVACRHVKISRYIRTFATLAASLAAARYRINSHVHVRNFSQAQFGAIANATADFWV